MKIETQRHPGATVLKPLGPLAESDVDDVEAQLKEAVKTGAPGVILDASHVAFIDSRGLEVLVDAAEQLIRGGTALKIAAANETLREVLELTELSPLFEQFDTVDAALKGLP